MTQLEAARQGRTTPEMEAVAADESVGVQELRERIRDGLVVIPANRGHRALKPVGVGLGLRTKVNANIGTSPARASLEDERAKLGAALDAGADTVMDLSIGGDIDAVRRAMRALIQVTLQFGTAQIEAGADALTLADHATRDLCRPTAYRDFLLEIHQELNQRLACPLILHICGDRRRRGREGGPSYRGHRSGVRRAVGRALAKPAAAGQGSQAAKRRRRRGLRNQMRRGPSGKRVCSTAFRRPGSGIRVPAACSA